MIIPSREGTKSSYHLRIIGNNPNLWIATNSPIIHDVRSDFFQEHVTQPQMHASYST